MKIAITILLGLFTPAVFFAASVGTTGVSDDHIRHQGKTTPGRGPELSTSMESGTYQQDIDHSGLLPGQTFAQRYWYDTEYASQASDAPVLYHMCGEEDVVQSYFLTDNVIQWAKTLGANIVWLEHRYYGQSLPFPDLSAEHMLYLTLDNVMEDLATFQKWISTNQGWTGQWLSVGGSYSGTLSALYRQKHPELVIGSLASSAPMVSGIGDSVGTEDDVQSLSSTDPSSDTGERQWAYQACTTFGFWEAEGATPGSQLDSPSSWLCQQVFGNVTMYNSTAYNQSYDLPFISNATNAPSNILFTYGSDDIWTTLGISQQTNLNTKITIQVIDGAQHHFDLNAPDPSDSQAVINARNEFVTQAKHWLGTN